MLKLQRDKNGVPVVGPHFLTGPDRHDTPNIQIAGHGEEDWESALNPPRAPHTHADNQPQPLKPADKI